MRRFSVTTIVALSCVILAVATPGARADRSREVAQQESFEASPGGLLRIDVPDADLNLKVGTAERVEIEIELAAKDLSWARERFAEMDFRASGDSAGVSLTAKPIRSSWGQSNGGFSVIVNITHPEGFNLDVKTGDGDVRLEAVDGDIKLRSGDGDVSIGRARGSDALITTEDGDISAGELLFATITVRSGDGDVSLAHLEGQQLEVRTSDGDIAIASASGALNARSGDGELNVGLDGLSDATLKSGDGDITIRGDGNFAADIDLQGGETYLRSAASFDGERQDNWIRGSVNGGGSKLIALARDGSVVLDLR